MTTLDHAAGQPAATRHDHDSLLLLVRRMLARLRPTPKIDVRDLSPYLQRDIGMRD